MDTRTLTVERSTSTAHRLTHYDGACSNVHGHNMDWELEVEVSMEGVGDDNMPLDFKDLSDLIDETDHAILLNEDDPLLEDQAQRNLAEGALGDVMVFESDPTCELISQWMAKRIVKKIESVLWVQVTIYETDKYGMTAEYPTPDEIERIPRGDG